MGIIEPATGILEQTTVDHKELLMSNLGRAVFVVLSLLISTPALASRGCLIPRTLPNKLEVANFDRPGVRLLLKLQDDIGADARGGRLEMPSREDILAPIQAALAAAGPTHVERTLRTDRDRLDILRGLAERRSGREAADLTQVFTVQTAGPDATARLLETLLQLPIVEYAFFDTSVIVSAGDFCPKCTPDFSAAQGYLGPAPVGMDVLAVRGETWGRADGIMVKVLDDAASVEHEDLSIARAQDRIGSEGAPPSQDCRDSGLNHGTIMLGIIVADEDDDLDAGHCTQAPCGDIPPLFELGVGCGCVPCSSCTPPIICPPANVPSFVAGSPGVVGVSPKAWVRIHTPADCMSVASYADAILATLGDPLSCCTGLGACNPTASRCFAPGGVVSISKAFGGTCSVFQAPLESNPLIRDAIQTLTAAGVHFVEAAGDGNSDLDICTSLLQIDSGAILVASATSTVPHQRTGFEDPARAGSNFGSRVDAFAWGDSIPSLVADVSFGDLWCPNLPSLSDRNNQSYMYDAGLTSAATPMVAGAVAVLEAANEALHFHPYHPYAARLIIRTTGTPSANGDADKLGRMPNLLRATDYVRAGQNAAHGLVRTSQWSKFGAAVAIVGDMDSPPDGVNDLAVSDPTACSTGRVYVYSGRTGSMIGEYYSPLPVTSNFGAALASADIDGDGRGDLVVGATDDLSGGPGKVFVFLSTAQAPPCPAECSTSCTAPVPYDVVFGPAPGSGFGWSVKGMGDIFGTPSEEIVVGAPYADGTKGRATVHSRTAGSGWIPIHQVIGRLPGEFAGMSVATAGRVDADPVDDFVVGVPGRGSSRGAAEVRSGANNVLIREFTGALDDMEFGFAVSGAGDLDGDGRGDIAIGAPGALEGRGRVYVVSAFTGAPVRPVWNGLSEAEWLGYSVAGVGNVWDEIDGPQVLAGGPGFGLGGRAILFGMTGGYKVYRGQVASGEFGLSVGGGAIDADAFADIVIGAPAFYSVSGERRVYSFLGSPDLLP